MSRLVLMNARLARCGVGGALSAVEIWFLGIRQRDNAFSVEISEE